MFNASHVRCIKAAKALGDFLYVGIHSDELCRSKWGSSFPIMDLHERALCVLSNKFVDEVVLGAPWEVDTTTMRALKLDVVCDGGMVTKLPSATVDSDMRPPATQDRVRAAVYKDAIAEEKYTRVDQVEGEGVAMITLGTIIARIEISRAAFKKRQQKKVKAEDTYMEGQGQKGAAPDEV